MKKEITGFLSDLQPFVSIPKKEIENLSETVMEEEYLAGSMLFKQGISEIKGMYIVKEGELELYFEKEGKKETVGYLKEKDVLGGISILMNSGIMVRNIRANKDTVLYVIPKKKFLELCAGYNSFYKYFVDSYGARIQNKKYASVLMADHAKRMLTNTAPFSFMQKEDINKTALMLSVVDFPKNVLLFTQDESKIEHIYILRSGSATRARIEDNKKSKEIMEKGDIFGGYSILANKGIAFENIKIKENASFYKLAREHFLNLCSRFPIVRDYFTDTFGEKILKKSYYSLIAGSVGVEEDVLGAFHNTIGNICNRNLIFCEEEDAIQKTASIMKDKNCGSILVRNNKQEFIGIITDTDLRNKVVAAGYDALMPASSIMSSPLITVSEHSFIFEAILKSMQDNKRHVIVSDTDGKIAGIATHKDILNAQSKSPFLFIEDISKADTLTKIIEIHNMLPKTIHDFISKGAKAKHITKFVSAISGSILDKLIEFTINDIGEPPVKFVFMIMGSEGRYEQTLKTDQDNAIIFEDVSKNDEKQVKEYFLKMGEKVCNMLDKAGYSFCKGNIMAKNSKLCASISQWKNYFNSWIYEASPEDLLHAGIFFDFRKGWGYSGFINELKTFLFDSLKNWSGFFRRLAENALYFKPPLNLFRQFKLESKGEHKNSFDIKLAMTPIVDFARIYALQNSIRETNTHERLSKIYDKKVLSRQDYKDIDQSYDFMMQLRFVRQVRAIVYEKKAPDNYINPDNLSRLERKILKEIFKKIEKFQDDSSLKFMGV
ncbi:MAG: cyclic nucleotide-binding domain-containing protein [Deltaproteobacteria bacterium]|nr:cyclic nucleotide-binding domain-containing protein [Deltaproteobacteria bacterium]